VPRQRRPSQNWPWGPKLSQDAKFRGWFCSFFFLLKGPKSQLWKSAKTAVKPNINGQS